VITDFQKQNHGIKRAVPHLMRLGTPASAISEQRGTKIHHQIFLDEKMKHRTGPSEIDGHTWQRLLQAFSDQSLAVEV
jgi:hypothetical protein